MILLPSQVCNVDRSPFAVALACWSWGCPAREGKMGMDDSSTEALRGPERSPKMAQTAQTAGLTPSPDETTRGRHRRPATQEKSGQKHEK